MYVIDNNYVCIQYSTSVCHMTENNPTRLLGKAQWTWQANISRQLLLVVIENPSSRQKYTNTQKNSEIE